MLNEFLCAYADSFSTEVKEPKPRCADENARHEAKLINRAKTARLDRVGQHAVTLRRHAPQQHH